MKKTLILLMSVLLMTVLVVSCENTPTEYTVKFDLNEGTGTAPDQKVVSGNRAEKPADPKKTNAAFKFWSKDGSTEFKFDTPITEDTTLKAVWQTEFKVGDIGPAGGYIFYDCDADNSDENNGAGPDNLKSSDCGWRYLEAANSDLGEKLMWYSYGGNATYNTLKGIGEGKNNTDKLKANGIANFPAADACLKYEGGGYSDWFLPSLEEMKLMFTKLGKDQLDTFVKNSSYWTSSEKGNGQTYRPAIGDSYDASDSYVVPYFVRPARSF